MTENKTIFIIFLLILSFFLLLFLFPSVNSKITIQFYNIKNVIYKPIDIIEKNISNYLRIINLNNNNLIKIKKLNAEIDILKEINSNLLINLSKFNELNEILFNQPQELPKSVGVKIIGNKQQSIEDMFVIDKGYSSGVKEGDYLIKFKHIIGRVKESNFNNAKVVSIFNKNYGDEVIIGKKTFIVSGTNDDYLIFIRQKNSTEQMKLNAGEIVKIKINNFYAELGKVELLNSNYIIKPFIKVVDTARVLIND